MASEFIRWHRFAVNQYLVTEFYTLVLTYSVKTWQGTTAQDKVIAADRACVKIVKIVRILKLCATHYMTSSPSFSPNSSQQQQRPLKVGFDLDGVLLYNPARIVRPLISTLKKKQVCIHRQELEFYVPQKRWEEIMWELFHKSSIFLAPGFKLIGRLKQQNIITPYLITGRFGHLQADFQKWKAKMGADELFVQAVMNKDDQQPHLFKQRMINQFELDVFIEDNWDIVHYLDQTFNGGNKQKQKSIYWISNFVDRKIEYPYKFFKLKQALSTFLPSDNKVR
jgi:hypothetical protein